MAYERTKTLKFKKNAAKPERVARLQKLFLRNECKLQFVLWAERTSLDIAGIYDGEPVFRPAICAWEAWQAAWQHLSANK